MNFKIAIVGKPNVGKSTLFNRLCGKKIAIVNDVAGVTRDHKQYSGSLGDLYFEVIDTAGWENRNDILSSKMTEQSLVAASLADVVLFVVDGKNGITTDDTEFAMVLRKKSYNVIVLLNKSEGGGNPKNDVYKMGFSEEIYISAEHGLGMDELYHALIRVKKDITLNDINLNDSASTILEEREAVKITIIGRPNVGKSTLFNKIIGHQRTIVSDIAGTTRDSINYCINYQDKQILLIDTAGMRKKTKINDSVENMSAIETINAIRRSHITLLVIDAENPLENQEIMLANIALKEGKALIIIVNKYDLINHQKKQFQQEVEYLVKKYLFSDIAILYISALNDNDLNIIMDTIINIDNKWQKYISTGKLNKWLEATTLLHLPPLSENGKRIRFKYITQIAKKPPSFKLFTNNLQNLPSSYITYLTNSLRSKFALQSIPIRIQLAKNKNPYNSNSNSN